MREKVVDDSGGLFPIRRLEEARRAARFVPRGWAWVDPYKEAKAASESIANGTSTRSQFIREQGNDPLEVFDEAEFENRILKEKGLVPAAGSAGTAGDPLTEEGK
jgi:capsid protein